MTRIGRRSEPLADLMAEAAHAALAAAGVETPDAIVVAAMNPEEFLGDGNFASNVGTHLGFAEVPAVRIETATSSGAAALYAAFTQVAAGLREVVLVVGGEKMTHLSTPRVSELIGRSIDPYERSYGATMPALAGLITRALITEHGATLREIAQVAVKNHANAGAEPVRPLPELRDDRGGHGEPRGGGSAAPPALLPHLGRRGGGGPHARPERAVRVAGIGQGTDTLAVRHRRASRAFGPLRPPPRPPTPWPASVPSASTSPRSTTPSPPSS